jgi:hypothetical protein
MQKPFDNSFDFIVTMHPSNELSYYTTNEFREYNPEKSSAMVCTTMINPYDRVKLYYNSPVGVVLDPTKLEVVFGTYQNAGTYSKVVRVHKRKDVLRSNIHNLFRHGRSISNPEKYVFMRGGRKFGIQYTDYSRFNAQTGQPENDGIDRTSERSFQLLALAIKDRHQKEKKAFEEANPGKVFIKERNEIDVQKQNPSKVLQVENPAFGLIINANSKHRLTNQHKNDLKHSLMKNQNFSLYVYDYSGEAPFIFQIDRSEAIKCIDLLIEGNTIREIQDNALINVYPITRKEIVNKDEARTSVLSLNVMGLTYKNDLSLNALTIEENNPSTNNKLSLRSSQLNVSK